MNEWTVTVWDDEQHVVVYTGRSKRRALRAMRRHLRAGELIRLEWRPLPDPMEG